MISILILNKDNATILKTCIESIEKFETLEREYIIVDNGSELEETYIYYNQLKKKNNVKIIIRPSKFNYSRLNNIAVNESKGDYLLLLNNDIEFVSKNTLNYLLELAKEEKIGAVGIKMLYPNDLIQHIGVSVENTFPHHPFKLNNKKLSEIFPKQINCSAVTGACLMISRTKFLEVNGLNEELEVIYNDVDLCLKLRKKGYENVCINNVYLYHYESLTRGKTRYIEDEQRFYKIWTDFISEKENQDFYSYLEKKVFLEKVVGNYEVYIFGASKAGERAVKKLQSVDVKVLGFIDNDSKKQGKNLSGVNVISLIEVHRSARILIASSYAIEIAKQLYEAGYKNYLIL